MNSKLEAFRSFFFLLVINLIPSLDGLLQEEIESHLELGRQMLARGQYNDALSHYHSAIEADSTNYLTYYRRATVYLAIGKARAALDDLNQVISLKPDFTPGRLSRGNVLFKLGQLDEAHIDFEWVLRIDPTNEEALHVYSIIEPLKHDVESAYVLMKEGDWPIDLLTRLIQEIPWNHKLREMRSICFEKVGRIHDAISDLEAVTKSRPDNTEGYLKLSSLYYELGEVDRSLATIRECLRLDPDQKECWTHYRKTKKLAAQLKSMNDFAQSEQYMDCFAKGNDALRTEKVIHEIVAQIKAKQCQCLSKSNNPDQTIAICSEALKYSENSLTYCDRADAHLQKDDFDSARSDFAKARELNPKLQRAEDGLHRVQKLEKASKNRDYYKILGVQRNAGKREIVKAYRKMAQKWHPDNFQNDEKEKKIAEQKFIDIAAAKEVLSDPEKRRKFDNGEDPLDPESQQHPDFNPFQHTFFTFTQHF